MFKLGNRVFIAIAFVFGIAAEGATLSSLKLTPDGSSTPPGDRFDFSVIFAPAETVVKLEVRAYYRPLDAAVEPLPILANGKGDFQDEKRAFLITKTVEIERQTELKSEDVNIVVPYEALDLPDGKFRLFYQIRGTAEVPFEAVTEVSLVSVGGGSRGSMKKSVTMKEKEETNAYRIVEGEKPIPEKVTIPKEFQRAEDVKVEIPNKFERIEVSRLGPEIKSSEPRPILRKRIHFATNRAVKAARGTTTARLSVNSNFGDTASNEITYGQCDVHIPIAIHKRGEIEMGSWWKNDPKLTFFVEALSGLTRDQFVQGVTKEDILLFIHGYNNTFKDALVQTAQLQHDIAFPGRGVTFSWPSQGETTGYGEDEKMAAASPKALAQVILDLIQASQGKRIHILAHSMGNRILLNSLRNLEVDGVIKRGEKKFANIVLAAPDVDINEFGSLAPTLARQAERVTFYYSRKDMALDLSERLHLMNRAGLFPFFTEGMDTVNADGGNEAWVRMRHSYYASSDKVLTDLLLLFNRGLAPTKRLPPLALPEKMLGFDHWKFTL